MTDVGQPVPEATTEHLCYPALAVPALRRMPSDIPSGFSALPEDDTSIRTKMTTLSRMCKSPTAQSPCGNAFQPGEAIMTNGTATMNLEIAISDPDLCAELAQYPSGPERAEFAITAMKIGSWLSDRHRASLTPNRFAGKTTASLKTWDRRSPVTRRRSRNRLPIASNPTSSPRTSGSMSVSSS